MKIIKLAVFGLSVLLISGCSLFTTEKKPEPKKVVRVAKPQKLPGEVLAKAPKYINWEGYYHGKLPCSDCQGVDTWLKLSVKDGRTVYDLSEKFLGKKNVLASGGLGWLREGNVAKLFNLEGKYLFLGNGAVTFIDSPFALAKDAYTLEKFDVFKNANAALLVNPQSIQAGKMGGKLAIKFTGVTNFEIPTPSGYKSLRSTYLLKCMSGEFRMSRIAYYDKKFTSGNFVYPNESLSNQWHSADNSTLMTDIKNRYCNR